MFVKLTPSLICDQGFNIFKWYKAFYDPTYLQTNYKIVFIFGIPKKLFNGLGYNNNIIYYNCIHTCSKIQINLKKKDRICKADKISDKILKFRSKWQ